MISPGHTSPERRYVPGSRQLGEPPPGPHGASGACSSIAGEAGEADGVADDDGDDEEVAVGPGAPARLGDAGDALAAPWPALHAVARRAATTITVAVGDPDHLRERFMFTLRVSESRLCSR